MTALCVIEDVEKTVIKNGSSSYYLLTCRKSPSKMGPPAYICQPPFLQIPSPHLPQGTSLQQTAASQCWSRYHRVTPSLPAPAWDPAAFPLPPSLVDWTSGGKYMPTLMWHKQRVHILKQTHNLHPCQQVWSANVFLAI